MANFKVAKDYVDQPKGAYKGAPSGMQPERARTHDYTPELSTKQACTTGSAPKHNKQPTES